MADSQFHEQHFNDRFAAMGDEAEGVFEAVWPRGWARYGLNRPPIQMAALPPMLRYTPDYITSTGLVEVQGFGRGGSFKLKTEKYKALCQWQLAWHVDLFLWDKTRQQWGVVDLSDLDFSKAEAGVFSEGKPYWQIDASTVQCEWTALAHAA